MGTYFAWGAGLFLATIAGYTVYKLVNRRRQLLADVANATDPKQKADLLAETAKVPTTDVPSSYSPQRR